MDVLWGFTQGKHNKEIAEDMVISPKTVEWYAHQIFIKLGVPNRTAAACLALRYGWFNDRPENQRIQ
jgi:DNA-binding NarL/FixJ family response regulator